MRRLDAELSDGVSGGLGSAGSEAGPGDPGANRGDSETVPGLGVPGLGTPGLVALGLVTSGLVAPGLLGLQAPALRPSGSVPGPVPLRPRGGALRARPLRARNSGTRPRPPPGGERGRDRDREQGRERGRRAWRGTRASSCATWPRWRSWLRMCWRHGSRYGPVRPGKAR